MALKIPDACSHFFEPSGKYRYRAAWGGRGSSKTLSAGFALVIKATQRPLLIMCCREVQRSIKDSSKRVIDNCIKDLGLRGKFESTLNEVRSSNGSTFIFEGLRQNIANIKSKEGIDIVWTDEAQSVSQNSIETLVPTIRKPDSELWFTWNPRFQKDPVDRLFRGEDGPPPRSVVRKVNYNDNPFFPDVLREEMEWDKARSPGKYQHIWCGEYLTHSEARVFKNWKVEAFETPEKVERFYFGADWGFSVDPTTLIRCFIKGRTLFIDQEAYKLHCPIEQTPALFRTVPGSMQWPIVADSARPETISYMRSYGFKMFPAKKGEGSIEDGIEFMKNYDIVIHPRCTHTADEFSMYSYKTDKDTNEILPILEDENNHCLVGETLVETVAGPIPIKDLVGWSGFLVSYDGEGPSIQKFDHVRKTREDAEIFEVEFEDGTKVQSTGDHLFLLEDGTWKPAQELTGEDVVRRTY